MSTHQAFGVDVGGSAVKGAPVDLREGALSADRVRVVTPQPATPDAVADVVAEVVAQHRWKKGPIGVAVPCVVRGGVAMTAANVHPSWIGTDARALLSDRLGAPVTVLNDADAAGLAEVRFGHPRARSGTVLMLTLGTGIGSALLVDGVLVPNTELGHVVVDGVDGERRAAAGVRDVEKLSWAEWAGRLSRYLQVVENLLWPDLVVLGGGVSGKAGKWLDLVECRTEVVTAKLQNTAGIVGAAAATTTGSPD